jgi:hypothetical protein
LFARSWCVWCLDMHALLYVCNMPKTYFFAWSCNFIIGALFCSLDLAWSALTLGSQLLNICSYSKCFAYVGSEPGRGIGTSIDCMAWNHRFAASPTDPNCDGRGSWVRCCMPARARTWNHGRLLILSSSRCCKTQASPLRRGQQLVRRHCWCHWCVASQWPASSALILFKKVVLMQSPCVCCANRLWTWSVPCTAFLTEVDY